MRQNPERLAWVVLLLSFFICVSLAVLIPVATQRYLLYSYTGELITLDVQEGNLQLRCPGSDFSITFKDRQEDPCQGREGAIIITGPSDRGQLSIHPRGSPTATLASVDLYPGTRIQVRQARAPRFSFSREPHRVELYMEGGRIRAGIPSHAAKNLVLQTYTQQALVQLMAGNSSIEVNNQETQVAVGECCALVVARSNNTGLQLEKEERTVISTGGGITGKMPAERNLLAESDFRVALGGAWKPASMAAPQIEGESPGFASIALVEDRQVLDFSRVGVGHAETGVTQEVNRDIRDFRTLSLHIVLRVLQQDVPVCGSYGTECPLMVRLDYWDEGGGTRSWLKGFFYLPDPNRINPQFCLSCVPRNDHQIMPSGTWYAYDSPNILPDLLQVGPSPVILKSITLYASGHTYQAQVDEIELLGQE